MKPKAPFSPARAIGAASAGLLLLIPPACLATEPEAGLARRYPGDRGLDRDPQVLWSEDFEHGALDAIINRWSEASPANGGEVLALEAGGPPSSARCLRITAHPGRDTGGHLYKKLPRAVDRCFARFYVKFSGDPAAYIHHFFHLGGYRPATAWPQGGAGDKPAGDDRVTVGIEPTGRSGALPAPGAWNFYAYWQDMKPSADGRHWGQSIAPERALIVPQERWQCVELMMALNSAPDAADGELALWLDGREVMRVKQGTPRGPWTGLGFALPEKDGAPFEGFRFRNTTDLKINFVWLLHYVTEENLRRSGVRPPFREVPVWFDNIVVATTYIGPLEAVK